MFKLLRKITNYNINKFNHIVEFRNNAATNSDQTFHIEIVGQMLDTTEAVIDQDYMLGVSVEMNDESMWSIQQVYSPDIVQQHSVCIRMD